MSYLDLFDDELDIYDDFILFDDEYQNAIGSDEVKESNSLFSNTGDIPYQITVTNSTAGTLNLVLFGSNQYLLAPNFGSDAGLVVTPSQSNINYQTLLQQTSIRPFKTKLSRIQSSNNNQATQVVNVNVVDADGNASFTPLVTQEFLSAYQSQAGLLDIPFEFSIDDQTSLTTQVLANTTVTYTFYPYLLNEKTDKKEEDKSIKKVQFTLVNNTVNTVSVNLFNTDSLIPQNTATNFTTPSTVTYSTNLSIASAITILPNGNQYISFPTLSKIEVYDSNNVFLTIIPIIGQPSYSRYNPINNSLYVTNITTNSISVINCTTNTVSATIGAFTSFSISIEYASFVNQMYIGIAGGGLIIINCHTNTITTVTLPYLGIYNSIAYNSIENTIILPSQVGNEIQIFDCENLTFLNSIALSFSPVGVVYCPTNNSVYVTYSNNTIITLVSLNTNAIIQNITFGFVNSSSSQAIYVSQFNMLYFSDAQNGFIYELNPVTNTIVNNLIIPTSLNPFFRSGSIAFSLTSTTLYSVSRSGVNGFVNAFAGSIVPYYISSSANYNVFIQSIANNPIQLFEVKFVSNQTQLKNVVNIEKIDANGISSIDPFFPINTLSTDQRQGNITYVDFKGMVLDGRTFFSDYNILPFQSITLMMTYRQPDLTSSKVLKKLFHPSKRLKETIDDDLQIDKDVIESYPLF